MFYTMGVEDCLETLYQWVQPEKTNRLSKTPKTSSAKPAVSLENLEFEASERHLEALPKLQRSLLSLRHLDSVLFESLCLSSERICLGESDDFSPSHCSSNPASPPPRPWGGGRILICPQKHWGLWDYCEALIDQLSRQLMGLDEQRRPHYTNPQVWPLMLSSRGGTYSNSNPPPELRELVLKFLSAVEVLLFRRRLRSKLLDRSSMDLNFLESPGKVFPNTAELLLLGYHHLISLQSYKHQGWVSARLQKILIRAESHLNSIHLAQSYQVPLAAAAHRASTEKSH